MKQFIFAAVLVACVFIQAECCRDDCKDINPVVCPLIKSQCKSKPELRSYCLRSCDECTPCDPPTSTIAILTTTRSPARARNLRLANCSNDCRNSHQSCDFWKEKGFCEKSSEYFFYMQEHCHLSCGACKLCPTKPPQTTALSETEPSCSPECLDDKETAKHCEKWKKQGHCSEKSKFPHVRKVCAMTCGMCFPCACSDDCKDDNESAKFCDKWKKEGFCNETSKYPYVRKVCSMTCGMCFPCTTTAQTTTAAIPTTNTSNNLSTPTTATNIMSSTNVQCSNCTSTEEHNSSSSSNLLTQTGVTTSTDIGAERKLS